MAVRALSPRADPETVVFAVSGRIDPEDVVSLCNFVCTRLQTDAPHNVICDLGSVAASDAVVIEALARLQLASRRRGCTVYLRNASRELLDLLELVGLAEVMPAVDA